MAENHITAAGTQELEVTVRLHVKIKAATVNCNGRPYTRDDLVHSIRDAIWEEMPYDEDEREDTDLVQGVMAVDVRVLD